MLKCVKIRQMIAVLTAIGCMHVAGYSLELKLDKVGLKPFIGVEYDFHHIINSTVPPIENKDVDSLRMNGMSFHAIEGKLGLRTEFLDRFSAELGFQSRLTQEIIDLQTKSGKMVQQKLNSGPSQCRLDIKLGNVDNPPATATVGYFNYRYAPEVHDLGEYLLTAGSYPGFVFSGGLGANLLGLQFNLDVPEIFQQDFLITSEAFIIPYFDISLAYLAHLQPSGFFKFTAGIMANRLITADEGATQPKRNPVFDPESGDSAYLTFAGVKLMGRVLFDFLQFASSERLSEQDLKLYIEAAVLGVKDYPQYYDNIAERIPVAIGFHAPTFGLLDVLALEAEWYGSPHTNNPGEYTNPAIPTPRKEDGKGFEDGKSPLLQKNAWRWGITGKKTLYNSFSIQLRIASDHLRFEDGKGWYDELTERVDGPDEWYYNLVLSFDL